MQPNPTKLELAKSPIFLIAPFFFLGTSMVAMKAAIPDTTPLFLASFRLVPAGIAILGLTLLLKLPQPKTWKAWLWIGVFSLVDGAMFQGFLTEGLVNTGAGLGAVLIDAQPLVVAVLARLLFGDVVGLWGWLGLAIGFVGICLCGLPESWVMSMLHGDLGFLQGGYFLRPENLLHSGELLMLLAALSMSLGTITIRYVKKHVDAVVATGWHMVLGGLPLFALSLFSESNQITNLSRGDWFGLGYATLFGTALTYGMFFYLASVGNLTSVSALIFLTPIFAMLFSSIFLGETLTQLQWIGVSLSLVGVILVVQREAIAAQWSLLLEKMGKQPPSVILLTGSEETSAGD